MPLLYDAMLSSCAFTTSGDAHENDSGEHGSRSRIASSFLKLASRSSPARMNSASDSSGRTRSDRTRGWRDRNLAYTWFTIDEQTTERYPAVAAMQRVIRPFDSPAEADGDWRTFDGKY